MKNLGPMLGDCVVLAFLKPLDMPTQPGSKLIQKLWQFERLADIPVGASQHASFVVGAEALALADLATGDIVSVPGSFELAFRDGAGNEATIGLTIEGAQRVLEPFPVV